MFTGTTDQESIVVTRPATSSSADRAGTPALAGLVAAAVAVGVGELVAGLLGVTSMVVAIGQGVIEVTPAAVAELTIAVLGGLDRGALLVGTLLMLAALSLGIGRVAARDLRLGVLAVVALGAVGAVASAVDPADPVPASVAPALAATVAGVAALLLLLRPARRADGATSGPADLDRRQVLRTSALLVVVAGTGAVGGRWLQARAGAARERLDLALPSADVPAAPLPDGVDLDLEGLSSFRTPNEVFYRIDTAALAPSVRVEDWRLRVHGLVDQPLELTYDDLVRRELVEADISLVCVSNEVGGDLIGNARWLGVRLDDLLAEVGVHQRATQLVGRSVDGYTGGFPVEDALDGRDALLAIGMNGAPLPVAHGYPVRLVVPGLYGYVSAVKWLAELELTTFDAFDQYWVRRGWAQTAPVKLQSRIDRPAAGGELVAGEQAVAGVAWAPGTGIGGVEVQVDDGAWERAQLADVPGADTWRQWVHVWDATPGEHRIRVRATDATGTTQPGEPTDPLPDGAQGWHTITVQVV